MLLIYMFIIVLIFYRIFFVNVVVINLFFKEYCWYIVEFCDLWINGSGIWKCRFGDIYGKIGKYKYWFV